MATIVGNPPLLLNQSGSQNKSRTARRNGCF